MLELMIDRALLRCALVTLFTMASGGTAQASRADEAVEALVEEIKLAVLQLERRLSLDCKFAIELRARRRLLFLQLLNAIAKDACQALDNLVALPGHPLMQHAFEILLDELKGIDPWGRLQHGRKHAC